jgi:hypothetical protein
MAEVDQMPVGHAAIDGRILTHRRNDDAIAKFQLTDFERRKQLRTGHRFSF